MALYNVQKFMYNSSSNHLFYGQQDELDYEKYVKFTLDIKDYLENEGYKNVTPSSFRSNQPKPLTGEEFCWNGMAWQKVYLQK